SAERALDPNAAASSAHPSWHAMDADNVIGAVSSHPSGLSDAEAKRRLAETGANAIAAISARTPARRCVPQACSVPIALLPGGALATTFPTGIGHEQHRERFAVVVQADEFLPRSVVIVAPTSRSARAASFRPEIDIAGERARVLVEQIGAVDAQRLADLMGHVIPEEMWGIDEALATVLGLD